MGTKSFVPKLPFYEYVVAPLPPRRHSTNYDDGAADFLDNAYVNEENVKEHIKSFEERYQFRPFTPETEFAWLLRAITCIDLTTLGGDDTPANVRRLCCQAAYPLRKYLVDTQEWAPNLKITTAAVCVYPSRVADAYQQLKELGVDMPVASVATGFPSGQYPLSTRLEEIKYCVEQGASEIDIVLNRTLVLGQRWKELYDEVKAMKEACGKAHMKTILAVGECDTLDNVYKASMVSMMAGSDFIKTSTGKETVNATLQFGLVMCRAIREFYKATNIKVGLKPAGGLKTSTDALLWLLLVKTELGDEWLNSKLFRIGASSLLGNIEAALQKLSLTLQKS